jgi:uncharacterized membrane protein
MQPKFKRSELDHLASFYSLDEPHVESLLQIAGARPSRAEGRAFLAHCLRIAGVLSLAAGLVFFVAANWSEIAVFGRFALIQVVLIACAAAAMYKPPPAFVGRGALFLAFIATGALLALFGQTYQTGADVHELFLAWALLGLPLVFVARWSVSTAAWVLVLNTALLLYCGWQPGGGLLWALLGSSRWQPEDILVGTAWLNLLLWFAAEWRRPAAVPDWVRRLLVSCAFLFATWAGAMSSLDDDFYAYAAEQHFSITPLAVLAAMIATVGWAFHRREDVYPLAVVMASFVIVTLVWIVDAIDDPDEGMFLLLALYLIGISTAGGRVLLVFMRRWRAQPAS